MAKDEYIGIRTTAKIKGLLEKLAKEQYRTLSQQCEMALIEYLKSQGYLEEEPD